ncbi:MAG TPA: copper homeostasis protein CutC [Chitinophagales bacterium]|nr:copper homeostasis protein CutC [Chitinophagales bacterium]
MKTSVTRKYILEICTFNATDVVHAVAAGADRIELCASYVEGGITPSSAAITAAMQMIDPENIVVMIRPRGGDFMYDDFEFDVMRHDILHCRSLGVKQVIFGITTPDGKLDVERNSRLIDTASGMQCTLQRAFDLTRDPFEALEDAITCGFTRILTSGQANTAIEGKEIIKQLITSANNNITLLPGAGVNSSNAREIIDYTGCNEIHTSAKRPFTPKSTSYNFNSNIYDTSHLTEVNPEEVRKLSAIIATYNA